MKLTLFLFFASCLQLSAKTMAQTISLSEKKSSLKTVLRKITSQTGVGFFYDDIILKRSRPVDVDIKNGSLEAVLTAVFKNQEITYEVVSDKLITLKERLSAPVVNNAENTANVLAPDTAITGKVADEKGQPMSGVTVSLKRSGNTTVTNNEGYYAIKTADDRDSLMFSFVGYLPVSRMPGSNRIVNVKMEPNISTGEDIVVVGYGTQKKVNLTGSVATVSGKDVRDLPVVSLSNAMAARMPGVNVLQNSGAPGVNASVQIRVPGSLNSNPPLYVIDGIVRDQFAFNGLDPGEVESISVLKDAASAAVYGSRAAGGVVLVTTRRGKKGTAAFNFSTSFGMDRALRIPQMTSAYEHAMFLNDAYDRIGRPATDPNRFTTEELEKTRSMNYDWLDIAWKDPFTTRQTLDVSGGSDKIRYFLSGSYFYQTGSFKNLHFGKSTLRANIDADVAKNLTASLSINYDNRNHRKPFWLYDSDDDKMENLYNALLKRPRWINPYTDGLPTGNFVDWHPLEILEEKTGYNRKRWNEYNTTVALEYKVPFVPGLSLKAQYNQFNRFIFIKQFSIPYPLSNFTTSGGNNHIVADNPQLLGTKIRNDGEFLFEQQENQRAYQLNAYATYSKSFGKHDISAVLVYEQAEGFSDLFNGRINFFISPAVDQFTAGGSADPLNSTVTGGGSESGRKSLVGRIGYIYADKYIVEASMRRDASSTFPKNNRWGNFPALSAAWRISQEPFFKIGLINDLKLKASVGLLGFDGVVTNQWRERFSKNTGAYLGTLTTGLVPGSLPNPNITWEKSLNYNAGIEARLLENKINFSLEGFFRKTYDILGTRTQNVPSTFGATFSAENFAQVNSKGMEMSLSYNGRIGRNANFTVGGNIAYAVNKNIIIDEASNIRDYQKQTGHNRDRIFGFIATDILREQKDIDALPAGYTINGFAPKLGMLNYKDIRGATSDEPDGKIDGNDQEFIGDHSVPSINYGINMAFNWKNLAVSILFQGTGGYKIMQDNRFVVILPVEGVYKFWADHWTPQNTGAQYPAQYLQRWGYDDYPASTFWMYNGGFLRLKNVNVSYNVQSNGIKRIGITGLKVFVNATNVFMVHDDFKLRDPETNSFFSYPNVSNTSLGLNISF